MPPARSGSPPSSRSPPQSPSWLILAVIAGAELFTGNSLMVMAWVSGMITVSELLRNSAIVYLANLLGGVGMVGSVGRLPVQDSPK